MIEDTAFYDFSPGDEEEIVKGYSQLLSNISLSKDTISKATKYAMENLSYHTELYNLIIKKMKKSTAKRRIALFYLIDSLCQNSKSKGRTEYIMLIANNLPYLINIMVCAPTKKDNSSYGPVSPGEKEQCDSVVRKVLRLWETRNILSIGDAPLTECIKEAYLELENPSSMLSPLRERSKSRLKHKFDEAEEDVEGTLRKIEEFRKESKRIKWESKLRPENDTEFGELEQMWNQIGMDDVRATIRDYDQKMLHYNLRGFEEELNSHKVLPSPFSPSSSLSSPSPSPSTPYSPTGPKKDLNTRGYPSSANNHRISESSPTSRSFFTPAATTTKFYSPSSPSSSPEDDGNVVSNGVVGTASYPPYTIIWDLDETLILFNSLKNDEYSRQTKKSGKVASRLFQRMERLFYRIMDTYMFFRQLECTDKETNINQYLAPDDGKELRSYDWANDKLFKSKDPTSYDPVKLAYRFRVIRDIYNGAIDLKKMLTRDYYDELQELWNDIDRFTDGWLSQSRKLLTLATENKQIVNVMVSSGQLIPTLAKMIMFKLSDLLPIQNLFSSVSVGKRTCFRRIKSLYNNKILVVGDGREEEIASKEENLTFFHVRSLADLEVLYSKLYKSSPETFFV